MEQISQWKIAAIVDDFTEYCLMSECKLLNLSIYSWNSQLEFFKPDFLLVESAWRGYQNEWIKKVSTYSGELAAVIQWCKDHNIPTIFWNKEDPVHFDTFFRTAMHFDWIFTTDMDSIPLYKMLLRENRIGLFPFATSPKVFHPIETYQRINGLCFAGSYYRKRIERSKTFDGIYDQSKRYMDFYIYDRNSHPEDINYTYPDQYQDSILGSLPVNQIDVAYKKYRFGLTMNTVQNSNTMLARRIFELMASNTITVSNESKAVRNMFGDLSIIYTETDHLDQLNFLSQNVERYEKQRLLALRKVLQQHTYRQRLAYVISKVLNRSIKEIPLSIQICSLVQNQEEADSVLASFHRQNYNAKTLTLISDYDIKSEAGVNIVCTNMVNVMGELGTSNYYAYFSPENYYGKNYLTDAILALEYSEESIIGKGSYFRNHDEVYEKCSSVSPYTYGEGVIIDRCILNQTIAKSVMITEIQKNEVYKLEGKFLSIDEYNFCENHQESFCDKVDDLELDTGIDMNRLYQIAESLGEEKAGYQCRLGGYEIYQDIDKKHPYVHLQLKNQELFAVSSELVRGQAYLTGTTLYSVDEFSLDNTISVCFRADLNEGIKLVIVFINDSLQVVKSMAFKSNCFQKIQIPEEASKFYIRFALLGKLQVQLMGVYLNPTVAEKIEI